MTPAAELQNLQIKAKQYFAKDPAHRTVDDRKRFLTELGVEHPGHFLKSVWSGNWDEAIDRVLDPRRSTLRPLEPTDFHMKWAVGAINLLPLKTRRNIIGLKLKPSGLETAIKQLLTKSGLPAEDFHIEDVEVLRFIHSEYALQLRTSDSQRVKLEISHYLPAAEELFHHFAEAFDIPVTTIQIGNSAASGKFVVELEDPDWEELSEASHDRLAANAEKIGARAGLHDAMGDVLGTIMRDPHYLLAPDGELYSFHHYQLFLDVNDEQFGFFQPVFVQLGEELGDEGKWYTRYRESYINEFNQIKSRSAEVMRILDHHRDVAEEYVGDVGELSVIRAGVEQRLAIDPEKRMDLIAELFCEQDPKQGAEG